MKSIPQGDAMTDTPPRTLKDYRPQREQLHRYTITSEGASPGYFRLVEDPKGAWVTWAEVDHLLGRLRAQPDYVCKVCGGTKPTCCSCPSPLDALFDEVRNAMKAGDKEALAAILNRGNRDRAKAAVGRLRAQEQAWQPIETAPKDGTHVLIATEDRKVFVALWARQIGRPPCWVTIQGWIEAPILWQPMPLPPPPTDGAALTNRECSCLGFCKGRDGLSDRWVCALDGKPGKVFSGTKKPTESVPSPPTDGAA